MASAIPETPDKPPAGSVARETALAIRNALVLSGSLIATLGVAIAVRFWMPRYLGPDAFGQVHFAESFTAASFVFLNLGVDTYINREIATRPAHASEFLGGVVIIRLLGLGLVASFMAAVLWAMGKSTLEWQLVAIWACGQLFFATNTTLQALLNARGEVRELAITNVASKFLWGGGVVLGLSIGGSVLFVAASFLVTEAGKTAVLLGAVKRHLDLELRWKVRPALAVLLAALPFFLNYLAHDIYARVDVLMLSWMTSDAEVGWYGAAVNINLLALLVLPVLNAVLLPMSSRVAQESIEALNEMMRGTLRVIIVIAVPLALVLVMHAEDIVRLLYSASFLPSQRTLQILAPMIPMSYVCVVAASHLVQLERVWTVTKVSIAGLVVHPLLNLVTIPVGGAWFGPGGAGMGAAAASLVSELIVTVLFLIALGRAGPDRRFAWVVARLGLVCAAVVALHRVLHEWSLFAIPLEMLVYVGLGTATGAIPLAQMWGQLRSAIAHRRGRKPES